MTLIVDLTFEISSSPYSCNIISDLRNLTKLEVLGLANNFVDGPRQIEGDYCFLHI